MKLKKITFLVFFISTCFFGQLYSQIYVDVNATGNNNGTSWANAYNHLNDALAIATSGDEIRIAQGNYYPDLGTGATSNDRNSSFTIPDGIFILGGYNASSNTRNVNIFPTILNGDLQQDEIQTNYAIHIITIGAVTATIDGVSIANGNADASFPNSEGAGIYINTGFGYNLTINQCTFKNNTSSSGGAAIRATNVNSVDGGTLRIDNSNFMNNNSFNGGAIKLSNNVTLNNSTFDNNTARYGGAIYIDGGFSTITNCSFTDNSIASPGDGGAIWSRLKVSNFAKFVGCNFINNAAPGGEGGAITIETATGAGYRKGIEVENCIFTGNTAQFGAAIRADNADNINIINSTFDSNIANSSGGGIGIYASASGAQPIIDGCTFTNNSASGVGGSGVYLQSTNAIVSNCLFDGNGLGSGFDSTIAFNSSSATLDRCIVKNNNAARIIRFDISGSPTISNSLIINNSGNAIDANKGGPLNIINTTFSGNSTVFNVINTASVNLHNSILWGNGTEINSFIGTADNNIIQGGFAIGTNIIDQDPLFVNSGAENFKLQGTSPGINVGDNNYNSNNYDLDGNIRALDGIIDLGPYEAGSTPCPPVTGGIIYVDASNTSGLEFGQSWAAAFTSLQDALDFHASSCGPVNEIWVAEGTYFPDDGVSYTPNDRNASFSLPDGVKLLGGFPSGGGGINSRNWNTNITRLSGAIGGASSSDNSTHVIVTQNVSSTTVLDGFIIEDGTANVITPEGQNGGAWYNVVDGTGKSSTPVVRNCIFQNNQSITNGGAIYNVATNGGTAEISFFGCQFISNEVTSTTNGFGGAIFNANTTNGIANIELINCYFKENTGNIGGTIRSISRDGGTGSVRLNIINSIFYKNNAKSLPGVSVFNLNNTQNINKIINSTFYENTTTGTGGSGGGGARLDSASSGSEVTNCIFWENTANETPSSNQLKIQGGSVAIRNNTIQDYVNTTNGNLASDPLFVDAANGNLHLLPESPAIDSGLNGVNTELIDLDGNIRTHDNVIDRGPYESLPDPASFFVTRWKTDNSGDSNNNQIRIPIFRSTTIVPYNFNVDWGDGSPIQNFSNILTTQQIEHTYSESGTYTVRISGDFPRIYFDGGGDAQKLISILNWGEIAWESMLSAFEGCSNLIIEAADTPDLSNVTNLAEMFKGATSINNGLENWDVSNVEEMTSLFNGATSFNGDISGWNVQNVNSFNEMFLDAITFNKNIGGWNTSSATKMIGMFQRARTFNQDIGNWDISSVESVALMFAGARSFDQDLGDWDVSNLSPTSGANLMFNGVTLSTENYDSLLIGWNTLDTNAGETAIPERIFFDAGNSTYCAGALARADFLNNRGWQILDNGASDIPPTTICKDITVYLDANGSTTIQPSDIDNGSSACSSVSLSISKTTFNCSNIGDNTVVLTVKDAYNNEATCSSVVTVMDTIAPTITTKNLNLQLVAGSITITPEDINNNSSDNCEISSMSLNKTTFDCSNIGENTVTLTVTDTSGNSNSADAIITIDGVQTAFTSNENIVCRNTPVDFTDASIAYGTATISSWNWDFGDGTSSTEQNPTHTFDLPGNYVVSLTITDSNGCQNTFTSTIKINSPKAEFAISPAIGGSTPHTVFFTDQSVLPDTWSWKFGDGSTSTAQNPIHTYTSFGDFTTKLTVTDTIVGCSDFTEKLVKIAKPNSNFTSNTQFGCGPLTVNFEDTSTVSGNDTIESWLWDFGDGTTSTEQNPTHIYENSGRYSVSLKTTLSTTGFTNTITKSNYIQVLGPNVNFTTTNTTVGCPDLTINFEDQTVPSSPAVSWAWNFGDGSVSNLQNPTHTYTTYGSYDVSLTVTDLDGCSRTLTKQAFVDTSDTIAPTAVCKPFTAALNANGMVTISATAVDGGSTDNCKIASLTVTPNTFTCANIGENTVTLIVTDENGNSTSKTAIVTVKDNIAPIALTKDITLQLGENGTASISAEDVDNGSYDACGIKLLSLFPTNQSFDCSNIGENEVKLLVVDNSDNVTAAYATVTVVDTTAPTVSTQNVTVQLDANGTASITVEDINNGSSDNCEIETFVLDTTTFDCTAVGDNTVTLTVTDVNGNTTTTTAIVTVEDNIAPIVSTQNITVQLDANGTASITVEDINNGSSDNCEIESMSIDVNSFDCTAVGDNTVTLTVIDVNGNSANATAVVTVEDNIAPTVITQNITVQLDANGTASITVEDINNGSSDNCGIESIVLDTTTFDCTAVGENTVTLIVTDVNGNTANGIAIVTVEDNIAPTVSTQNITVQLDANGTASITVEDINNGSSDNCEIESMSIDVTSFDCNAVGDNTVTLTVTDVNGNSAKATAVVTVEDNIAPIASCSAPFTIQLDETGSATITVDDINNGSSDNCEIESLTIDTTTFDCSNIGDNNVTLTVTDAYGNSSSVTTVVTIIDVTAPIVITQNISVELDETGNATISAEDIDDGSFDACGIATLSLDQTTFSCPTLGDTTVTLTVIDNNGNSASEMAIVTFTANDLDNDGIADVCDDDLDGDGVDNDIDNCPTVSNPNQADIDRNGIGDVCDQGELEIPKGFSPNGDGVNDEFIIAGLHKYPNNSIQIYNRYGNMVYESNNYQNYWDGVSSGKTRKLPAAPYFYVLSINGGTQIVKGWLYINY
jgi:gliding motility-associated-like protein